MEDLSTQNNKKKSNTLDHWWNSVSGVICRSCFHCRGDAEQAS
jgi:hypothetical protein